MSQQPLTEQHVVRRGPVSAAAGFCTIGLFSGAFAALLPAFQTRIHASDAGLGVVLLVGNLGALPGTLILGPLLCRRGRLAITLSSLAGGLCALAVGVVGGALALTIALALWSASIGALDVAINAVLVAHERRSGAALLQNAHAGYPVAAVAGSIGAGVAASDGVPLPVIFAVIAAAVIAVGMANLGQLSPSVDVAPASQRRRHPEMVRLTLLIGGLGAFCYAVESGLANWAAATAIQTVGAGVLLAALAPAVNSVGMTVGRVLAGRGNQRVRLRTMRVGALITAAGIGLIVAADTSSALLLLGFGICGFGIASWAPGLFAIGGHASHRIGSATLLGITTTGAYAGLIVMPGILGGIGSAAGLRVAMATLLVPTVIAGVMLWSGALRRLAEPASAAIEAAAD